jgi:hypothetical protein
VRQRWPWRARARRSALSIEPTPIAPVPVDSSPVDPEALASLLDDVRQLRLTLTADLAAAASAIDAGEPTIARDIIAGDRHELVSLTDRSQSRPTPQPAARREPARPRRALLALPAIPLIGALAMTGAAALNGGSSSSHVRADSHLSAAPTAQQSPGEIRRTAASTLHQLEQVVALHPRGTAVVAVAQSLHRQLTAILSTSANDPKRLTQVRQLLAAEQRVLETHQGHAVAVALAASRRIAKLLDLQNAPPIIPSPSSSPAPAASTKPTKSATPKPSAPKPTTSVSQTPQPHTSTTAPPNPLATPTPTSHPTHHAHHHHRHTNDPLFGNLLKKAH